MTEGIVVVHLDCRNASNPYHECVEFCFLKIAESKKRMEQPESDDATDATDATASSDHRVQESGQEEHENGDDDHLVEENVENEPRKANQTEVFNLKALYDAYNKRTKNIESNVGEYNKKKEADPEFYRDASSLQYGKAPKVSEDKIHKMVKELPGEEEKLKAYSRRRKTDEEKDIDSINDCNEHVNKKIEIAFGKYTLEIKNNHEKGTALQGFVGAGLFTLCISVAILNCTWACIR